MLVAIIMCLNYDRNLTNRRTSVRKCKYEQKDSFSYHVVHICKTIKISKRAKSVFSLLLLNVTWPLYYIFTKYGLWII